MVSAVPFFHADRQTKENHYLKEYLKAQNKTTDAIISNTFSTNELERFSKSDYRWADNRSKQYSYRNVKKGEIY